MENKIESAEVKKFDLAAQPETAVTQTVDVDGQAMIADLSTATTAVTQTVDVDGQAMIADLSTATTAYCSMTVENNDDRIKAYNAMSNAQESLAEHLGEEIPVRHIYVEVIKCMDEKTGEPTNCPRIVLITNDGRTFQAVSMGVFGSLKRIFQIFGRPDEWDFSLVLKAKRVKTRNGYYTNTLEAVGTIPD